MEMLIKPHNIIQPDVMAFFTTRAHGNNLKEILRRIGISGDKVYLPIQRHTNQAMILGDNLKPRIADAVLTKRKGVLIGVKVADCVPILLYDKKRSVIGAVHAGWRGTAAEILRTTIKIMQERFDSLPEDILIALGPGIRRCCYDVGEEVKEAVCEATGKGDYYCRRDGRYFIDLSSANRIQALSIGIPEQNIWQSQECTFCNPARFHSYRYSKNHKGKQGGFIGIVVSAISHEVPE